MNGNFVSNLIFVVEPHRLELKEQNNSKYFVMGREYLIYNVLKDSEGNRIWKLSQMMFHLDFERTVFHVVKHAHNFQTIQFKVGNEYQGSTTIKSKITYISVFYLIIFY